MHRRRTPRWGTADNVVLIGMRASGKSTVGAALARRLGLPLADLDDELARRAGSGVDRLLAEDGENRFREREAEVLRWAARLRSHVVATGGGAVLHGPLFGALCATGVVVYLRAEAAELASRSRLRPRPPLTPLPLEQEVAEVLRRRAPLYEQAAQITIPATSHDPVHAILEAFGQPERPCDEG